MITVLLIEDNDVDARLTQDLLAEWSVEEFKVTHAKTLSDGLAHIDKGPSTPFSWIFPFLMPSAYRRSARSMPPTLRFLSSC